ncbi:MAG: GAF domain-containing sensor histidine kinase [Chloroflexi bacterium]|nr:GAF domain-containing sensor histidine kinase [Chloroflexota bacterium]
MMQNVEPVRSTQSIAPLRKLLRRAQHATFWERKPLVGLVSYLRWAIPIAVSFVGIGYVLLETVVFQGRQLAEPSVLRTVIVIGLAGPVLVWISLTWAAKAAMAEAQAQKELALRNQETHRRVARLQIASQIGQRMSALLDLDTLLAEVVRLLRARFGYYQVHILLTNEAHKELVLREASGPYADQVKARHMRTPIDQTSVVGWVAQTGKPLLSNDVHQEPRNPSAELLANTLAQLAVPLRVGKHIIGVLDAQSDRLNAFSKEDVIVLEILGNQLGIAIENARLFQETKRRYEAMIALHETSLDMITQLNREELLQALLRRGVQLLSAEASSLFLYNPDEQLIYNVANYNTTRDWTGITVRPGEGAIGRIIETGQPIIVDNYETWEGRSEIFTGDSQSRLVGVPLRWRGQVIGGIHVLNSMPARPFDPDDLWLLSLFADLATIAVKNADLHTQVKNFSQELEQKVAARTRELSQAQEEIQAKAEQLRSLLAKTIDLQEHERARIARDMHDGVVQLITAARLELQAVKVVSGLNLSRAAEGKLNAARQVLEEAELEIRRAIYDLHSPILDAMGLVPALERHISRFHELTGIACTIIVNGTPHRLPMHSEVAVFRLVEEALNNVAAHSGGTLATITIDYELASVSVAVRDNGRGFDYREWFVNPHHHHLGLFSMQERVNNLGGEVELWSEPEQGTRVLFRLPIQPVDA